MDGEARGASGSEPVTSGGRGVTGGMSPRHRRRLMLAIVVLFAAIQGTANGVSRLSDMRGAGADVAGWMIATDEATSFLAWLLCMVAIWRLVVVLRPPRVGWPSALVLHLLATIPISLLHVGLMVLLREGAYALAGFGYDFAQGDGLGEILYEYRKDAPTYFLLAAAFAGIEWATRPSERADEARVLTVQDGSIRHHIPIDRIAWAEAAGNYVTIHWEGREVLHRATLTALHERLGSGFARIHRSRLVRRDAVRTIATGQSGDFAVTLDDGVSLRGSRRFREGLE